MYTSNELESLSTAFDERMRQLENEVMEDIIRRIRINGEITRSADWQINRLRELGMGQKEIENRIKKALNLSDDEVKKLYSDIIESGYARDVSLYKKAGLKKIPFEKNDVLQQLIAATAAQTANEMRNLSGSLGFAVRNADGTVHFTEIGKFYQDTVDNAINGIANGVFDYNTAIKKAVSALTNSGLRTVDYASGWSNRVDVAARRSVMTGISQLTGKINEQNAEELGTDMFEVTWHGGARPSHQVWQGRWYTKKQLVSVCGLGTVTGLCGANCHHEYYPVIPGISEPTYTEEQLREMNRKENIPVEYGGKQYTKYEALQHQRRLETKMRAQRQEIHLLEVGGASEDDIIAARCRYRVTSGEYTRFSKAMDLPQQRERVTVDGLGNVGVGKWKKKVDISGESGIIKPPRYYSGIGDKAAEFKTKLKSVVTPEKYKPISNEYLSSLPKAKNNESIEQALKATNPNKYKGNCQRCVPAYEMRRRGYAVEAIDSPENPFDDNIGLYDYKKVFVGADWITCEGTGKKQITEFLRKCGDGTRVEIAIVTSKGNHIFAAEQIGEKTIFLDPQRNLINVEKYFDMDLLDKTEFCRIDNLCFSALIKDCVEGAK